MIYLFLEVDQYNIHSGFPLSERLVIRGTRSNELLLTEQVVIFQFLNFAGKPGFRV